MPLHTWILTDVANRVWRDEFSIDVAGLDAPAAGVEKYTLRGGVSDGVDVIEVNNGKFAFSVLPTRGMGLWRGTCDGLPLGWSSPVAWPVNPAFVNALDRGQIGWLAGFNEWLCRCGLDANGPPGDGATLHGRIANIPAHRVEVSIDTDGPGSMRVLGIVDETMMFGPCLRLTSMVVTTLGSNTIKIVDEVTNLSAKPAELQLLYHTQFGPPFLEQGAQVELAARTIAPRDSRAAEGVSHWDSFQGPEVNFAEQVYFFDLAADSQGETETLLRTAARDRGVSLRFRKQELPCFSLWKNTQAIEDGYCTGLEPATNYPNRKAFEREQGRVATLAPGASRTVQLEITVHTNPAAVALARERIVALAGSGQPTVHTVPLAGWTPQN